MNYPENLSIGEIYTVKKAKVEKRLRVKINNRAVWCGRTIPNTYFFLQYICKDGEINVVCQITGKKYNYTGLIVRKDF
jgi:hypothetical protein